MEQYRGTTILSVRRNGKVVIGGDGQVTLGNTVMKGNARKVRRLYNNEIIAGFAGGLLARLYKGVKGLQHGAIERKLRQK